MVNRSENTLISFPKRVGDAGWPCVLANIGMSFQVCCKLSNFAINRSTKGMYCSFKASFKDNGIDVLLMSCEVNPK